MLRLLILVIQLKKAEYDTKITELEKKILDHNHDKHSTTQEFNQLTSENVSARLKQADLASQNAITDYVKKIDFE